MATYTVTRSHTGTSLFMYFIGIACLLAGGISFVLFLFFNAYIAQFPTICCTATTAFMFILAVIAFMIGISAKKTKMTDDQRGKDAKKVTKKEPEAPQDLPKFSEKNPVIIDAEVVDEKADKKKSK